MPDPAPRVDTHHHLWKYDLAEYSWLSDQMHRIRRDFLPEDLAPEMERARIHGTVAVQARQKIEETEWLLELAGRHPFILGVVGWVPLVDPDVASHLERFAANPLLKGVRHVLQDEPDDDYMLLPDFNRGVACLKEFKLAYDILIFERHLPQTIRFVDRHPDQVFVVDHIAKPRIRHHLLSPWAENLRALAERPNVYCKISGMVTEGDWHNWRPADFKPYFDCALGAFGPKRVMFGSDWPMLLVACDYAYWAKVVSDAVSGLSADEQQAIFSETPHQVYRL